MNVYELSLSREKSLNIICYYACHKTPVIHFRFSLCHMSEKKLLKSWDKDKLIRVVAAIRKNQMGFTKAQHLFNVPMTSLT